MRIGLNASSQDLQSLRNASAIPIEIEIEIGIV